MTKNKALQKLNDFQKNTITELLGIEITDFGPDYFCGKMPVDHRTVQPYGLLHGGASAVLAESLGSIAGGMQVNRDTQTVVGVEINCNHLRSARDGWVYGKATPIRIRKKIQVWEIKITNEGNELVCISRITLAVVIKR